MINKLLKTFGIMKIRDHDEKVEDVKKELVQNNQDSLTNAANLSKSLQDEIRGATEEKDKLKADIEEQSRVIEQLNSDKKDLKIIIEKLKNDNRHHLEVKHQLRASNDSLRAENGTWKQDYILLKKHLDGRIGGYVKETNKLKSQYLFSLSILFKKNMRETELSRKETEIFLQSEYEKLKKWDLERKQAK
jgi:chromosome segregation ATPase